MIVLICNTAQLFIAAIYIRNPNLYMLPSHKNNCKTDRNKNSLRSVAVLFALFGYLRALFYRHRADERNLCASADGGVGEIELDLSVSAAQFARRDGR